MPTPAQIGRLWALGKACGMSSADVYRELNNRYGVGHIHDLTARQYEEFTRAMQWQVDGREVKVGGSEGPDLLASRNELARAFIDFQTESGLWGEMTPQDLNDALEVLNDFRLCRARTARLSVKQAGEILSGWMDYDYETWREGAWIYLTCYRRKYDEKYFLGILRKVAKRSGRERTPRRSERRQAA